VWVTNIKKNDIESFYNGGYFSNESKMGYRNYLNDEANHRVNARHILNIVSKIKNLKNLKILDVGSAFGFLLDEAKKLKSCDCYGIEISREASKYAVKELGLANISNDDQMKHLASNFFDVIFIIGTLEHLISPKETLVNIGRLLKKGGIAVITTIDIKGIVPLYSIKPPELVFYFNHYNISLLLNQTGFRTILNRPYFVNYKLYDLFYRLGEFLSSSILKRFSKSIGKFIHISFTIPTNEMIVVAEKV
jgi:2-polyprenyl-3-methyl-5-hydroxy-6-metoxy-1,4-benzoquinol methylase